jgi:hypothetical protein
MNILSFLDRIVLPIVILELPVRFKEFKSKSDAAIKKLDKLKAFQAGGLMN